MSFKKLALVTAMFAATTGAYAMEAMDDESMSAATGQDGITVTISAVNDITMNQIIHDKDGYAGAATPQGGAIVIGDVGGTTTGRKGMTVDFSGLDGSYATAADNVGVSLIIDADGGDATGSTPYLNIGVAIGAGLKISTGDLSVASSTTSAAGGGIGTIDTTAATTYSAVLLDSLDITLGATTMNIQLGAEPQGAMIKLNTTMVGGLTIDKMKLNDTDTSIAAPTSGSIAIDRQFLSNATGVLTNLNVDANIDVVAAGLQVTLNTVGTGGLNVNVYGVRLGTSDYAAAELGGWTVAANAGQANANLAKSIGDIEIRGLNLNGTTITLAGH